MMPAPQNAVETLRRSLHAGQLIASLHSTGMIDLILPHLRGLLRQIIERPLAVSDAARIALLESLAADARERKRECAALPAKYPLAPLYAHELAKQHAAQYAAVESSAVALMQVDSGFAVSTSDQVS